jgi:hypothetical protein
LSYRLTISQKYIFDSILKFFGKDLFDNIIIVATFGELDTNSIQVLKTINKVNIPYKYVYVFNNSINFNPSPPIGEIFHYKKRLWDINFSSYSTLFQIIQEMTPKS